MSSWYIKIHGPRFPWPPKATANLKSYLQKYLVLKKKSNASSYSSKNQILCLQENSLMFL